MTLLRPLPIALAAVLFVPASALAGGKKGGGGALGSVTSGISSKSSSSSRGSSGSSSSSSSRTRDHRSDSSSSSDSSYYASSSNCWDCSINTSSGTPPSYRLMMPKLDFRLAISMQSVENSDGAAIADARVTHKGYGFGLSSNSYYENNRMPNGSPERIRMDLWSLYGSARLARARNTHIDFIGGLAGARSNTFEHLIGGTVGLELVHRLSSQLRAEGSLRFIGLQNDVDAVEYRAGLRASFLYVGYREVEFNVGEPLRGPEAGVSLQF